MRTKKVLKTKEPIRLRAKDLSNGNKSLYLDCFKDGNRTYEFLRLYLIPETDTASKEKNAETLKAAKAIQARRLLDVIDEVGGLSKSGKHSKITLVEWFGKFAELKKEKGQSNKNYRCIMCALNHIVAYKGDRIKLSQVDKKYCLGFIEYLKTAESMPKGKKNAKEPEKTKRTIKQLSQSTQALYLRFLNSALDMAVKREMIVSNPIRDIDRDDKISAPPSHREYLTIDEIKQLIKVKNDRNQIKTAFLFGCFCGLRISDIRALKWGDIYKDGKQYRARIIMQKTATPISVSLSSKAMEWLPNRGDASDEDNVFKLPYLSTIDSSLKRMALKAGIAKSISFHTSRHTFATLMLTLGVDIYTTSKLLGHRDVVTTEIYGAIIDQRKDEAVNKINKAFK